MVFRCICFLVRRTGRAILQSKPDTERISIRDAQGHIHFGVGIFISTNRLEENSPSNATVDLNDVISVSDHEIQHILQSWDQPKKILMKSTGFEARLKKEHRPLPTREDIEKTMDLVLTALVEVQANDQMDPARLKRSSTRMQESR